MTVHMHFGNGSLETLKNRQYTPPIFPSIDDPDFARLMTSEVLENIPVNMLLEAIEENFQTLRQDFLGTCFKPHEIGRVQKALDMLTEKGLVAFAPQLPSHQRRYCLTPLGIQALSKYPVSDSLQIKPTAQEDTPTPFSRWPAGMKAYSHENPVPDSPQEQPAPIVNSPTPVASLQGVMTNAFYLRSRINPRLQHNTSPKPAPAPAQLPSPPRPRRIGGKG